MAPPLAWLVWWPLRKAAVIPSVALGMVVLGGFMGALDISLMATRAIARPPATYTVTELTPDGPVEVTRNLDRAAGTGRVAGSVSLVLSGVIVGVREVLRPKPAPLSQALPTDDSVPMATRIKNAGIIAKNAVRNYPFRHRMETVFIAGAVAGVSYGLTEKWYNTPARAQARAALTKDASE